MPSDKGQKSEKPTAKHRREARRDGRVARSPEIGSWLSLAALVVVLPPLGGRAIQAVTSFMAVSAGAMSSADPTQSLALLGRGLRTVVEAAGPLLLVAVAAAIAAGFGQVGMRFAPGALGLKWTRISPTTGLKRIFSPTGAWELTKMVVRLVVLVTIGFEIDRHLVSSLLGPGTLPLQGTLRTASATLISLIRDIAAAALLLAFVDYAFQRHRFNESLKMTKEEVRRELRETEGNPDIRRALRRRRRRLSRLQIYAAVAQADVVVVNPTHFSVGLRFDRAKDAAPRVVAKGEDDDAFTIREAARAHGVAIVENPPVARSLYDACEIGDLVPTSLYKVVARLLAFVYRLSPAARALVDTHKMVA
jgi:flagellar biosynthetic protein FlhB